MERPVVFEVGSEHLLGILHEGDTQAARGVLIVVGGPQYRVGSHRQFLLLARDLAAAGIPVFRFDYRGMGDSEGAQRDFERVGEDIRAAIDTFMHQAPQVREVALWGLCDAASASLLYAHQDPRVAGMVLANPWVRTEEGLARTFLKHYYLKRLVSREFWSGLVRGRLNPAASVRSLWQMTTRVLATNREGTAGAPSGNRGSPGADQPLPERMAWGWRHYQGPILLILSGEDLVAAEFRDVASSAPAWAGALGGPRVTVRELAEANHTFSRHIWREKVAQWTREWLDKQR